MYDSDSMKKKGNVFLVSFIMCVNIGTPNNLGHLCLNTDL